MKISRFLAFALVVLVAACVPRLFNNTNKSQLKNTSASTSFPEWFSSLPVGPIANYELTASVVFHKVGSEILPDFQKFAMTDAKMEKRIQLSMASASRGSADGGVSMVWMRDYQPFVIKSSDIKAGGKARFVAYLSMNMGRNLYTGTSGRQGVSDELLNPQLVDIDKEVIGAERDSISFLRMPLIVEGGNLIATGEHIFLTEHVFQQNSLEYLQYLNRSGRSFNKEALEKIFRENGFYENNQLGEKFDYRSPDQVISVLAKYLEVKAEKIVTLPVLPGEGTRHIDLYLLAMGKKHVMIPKITEEGIATLGFEHERPLARAAMDFLNAQAERLTSQYGYQVDRLEMVPPIYQIEQGGEKQAVYMSPANVLLANLGPDRKKVFIPHFEVPADWGKPFSDYSKKVEDQWKVYFEKNGWEPTFVTANKAARAYGLILCLTAPIPFLSERHMKRFVKLGY